MKKRVLLLSSVFPPQTGGSGRWFWEVYRRLPHDQYVIAAGQHPGALEFDQDQQANVVRLPLALSDWGCFSLGGYRRYRRLAQKVAELVRTRSVEAIHCGRLLPDAWIGRLVARRFNLPLLVYMHGEETAYADASRQLNWMSKRILRDTATVIANSNNTARILRERWAISDDGIEVLHPGVDCAHYVPAQRDCVTRQRLGWGERKVLLTVGRLQQRKGQDMVIRALPQIASTIPDILYAIVGDGDDYPRLAALTRELGVESLVQFHGELDNDNLLRCYQQCDLFALANRDIDGDIEGFGMVLLEAQACGKTVLAGNSGGTIETMRVPQTGSVIDCTTPDPIAKTVIAWMSDESGLSEKGQAARDWVVNRFDWSALARQALGIHAGLLPGESNVRTAGDVDSHNTFQ